MTIRLRYFRARLMWCSVALRITFRLCVCLDVSLDEMLFVMLCLWQHGLFHVSYHLRVTGLTGHRNLSLCSLVCCMTLYLSPFSLLLKLYPHHFSLRLVFVISCHSPSNVHNRPSQIPANYFSPGIHTGSRIAWLTRRHRNIFPKRHGQKKWPTNHDAWKYYRGGWTKRTQSGQAASSVVRASHNGTIGHGYLLSTTQAGCGSTVAY